MAILVFALGLEMVQFFLLSVLELGMLPSLGGILLMSMADLLRHFSSFYFYAIIFRVLLSFVVLMRYNPVVFTITQLTEPLLHPIRRVVPPLGGFDLSAIIVLVALQLFEVLVVGFLMHVGMGLL
jgi:YggT family protein